MFDLCEAVQSGNVVKVKELIENGYDLSERNEERMTPLILATNHESTEILDLLIGANADLNGRDAISGTALHHAAANGNVKISRALLDAGSDVEELDMDFQTPLMWACWVKEQNEEIIQLLLNHGADIDWYVQSGETAMDFALQMGNDKIVEVMKKGREEWSEEGHARFPQEMRDQVMTVMLMWMHDQYEEGECEGVRWNELPWEVVRKVIVWMAR
eukprot:TRINITY_DN6836_c0_g1_i7.p2 TRINITY_DN6836_c0_g1~~TRINITY_DN6836_c0_g1_i7.p2  ORF type:complete len:216 (-),score=55.57 TRINITY_DN6836_c0_g1_i7:425-1072(-)